MASTKKPRPRTNPARELDGIIDNVFHGLLDLYQCWEFWDEAKGAAEQAAAYAREFPDAEGRGLAIPIPSGPMRVPAVAWRRYRALRDQLSRTHVEHCQQWYELEGAALKWAGVEEGLLERGREWLSRAGNWRPSSCRPPAEEEFRWIETECRSICLRLRALAQAYDLSDDGRDEPARTLSPQVDEGVIDNRRAVAAMPSANRESEAPPDGLSLSDMAAHPVKITESVPLRVIVMNDPEKAKGNPGAPVKYPGVKEYVDGLEAAGMRQWKEKFEKCRDQFGVHMPESPEALKQYCRYPNKIV